MPQFIQYALAGAAILVAATSVLLTLQKSKSLEDDKRFWLRSGAVAAFVIILLLVVLDLRGALTHTAGAHETLLAVVILILALAVLGFIVALLMSYQREQRLLEKAKTGEQRLALHQRSYQKLIRERTATLQQEILRGQQLRVEVERHSSIMEADLRFTAQVQATLDVDLPNTNFANIAKFSAAQDLVNGDFIHDLRSYDGSIWLALGDAMGHGAAAGFMTVMVRTSLNNINTELAPFIVLEELNRSLTARDTGIYVTMVAVKLYPNGTCFLGSAGHPPCTIFRAETGRMERIEQRGFALGMFAELPSPYTQAELKLSPGDRLVCYSDGVTEAANSCGKQFELEGLEQAVLNTVNLSVDEQVGTILDTVYDHCGSNPLNDDISLLIVEFLGEGKASAGNSAN